MTIDTLEDQYAGFHDYKPYSPVDNDEPSGFMKTVAGAYIDITNPLPQDIYTEDIAHALSRICRFGGHTLTFYSVAEHSLGVAQMLWRENKDPLLSLCGLLHDATEAYLGDMIRPLKNLMPQYKEVEARFEAVIAKRFGLPETFDPRVKDADNHILAWEMALFRDARYRTPSDMDTVKAEFERALQSYKTRVQFEKDEAEREARKNGTWRKDMNGL